MAVFRYFIFTPKIGEDKANLTCAYFSNGLVKNHQPVIQSEIIQPKKRIWKEDFNGGVKRSDFFGFRKKSMTFFLFTPREV